MSAGDGTVSYDNPKLHPIASYIICVNFALSASATSVTLLLIHSMRKRVALKVNLFQKCVIMMSMHMLAYDLGSPPLFYEAGKDGREPYFFGLKVWGALGATAWATLLPLAALFTVHFGRKPTDGEQLAACVLVNTFCIAYTVPVVAYGSSVYEDPTSFHVAELLRLRRAYDIIRASIVALGVCIMLRLFHVLLQTT